MNGGIYLIQSSGDFVEMKEQLYDTEADSSALQTFLSVLDWYVSDVKAK
jgi:hypothetical protein